MALRAVAEGSTEIQGQPPEIYPNWESRVYQYEREHAIDAGFSVGSVKASANLRLLVMDHVRSATVQHQERKEVWGFGYRFLVEVSDISLVGKLTLPAIAGAVETTGLEASVRLEVKGYKGNEMWDVIPAPKPLDVDTYATYLTAVERIQAVFRDNPGQAFPVLLAEGRLDDIDILVGGIDTADLEASTILAWSLRRIARGASLATASEDLGSIDHELGDSAQKLLEGAYHSILGPDLDPSARPNEVAQAQAGSLLEVLD
jgi:hypothetical protein